MKLRYFLTSIIACLALAIGCTKEELPALSEITVTPSYFTFTVDGGAKELTVNALADWTVTDIPEWLTVAPTEGTATGAEGVKVTVTAQATQAEKIATATLKFNCAGKTQLVTVGQEAFVPEYPKFEAGEYWIMTSDRERVVFPIDTGANDYGYMNLEEAIDGKSTAENIFTFAAVEGENDGFTIVDTKGRYHVGSSYNSFTLKNTNPADGSEVWYVKQVSDNEFKIVNKYNAKTVYKSTYSNFAPYSDGDAKIEKENNLPCLVSASASDIQEVLFAVEPETVDVAKEADEFNINMTCKNEGFEINPSVDWITLKGMTSTNGEYVVTFACAENTEAARTGAIEFTSGEETITVTVNQKGSIEEVTIAEAIASDELCSVLGKVIFTHSKGVLITDGRDVLYGYLGAAPEVAVNDVVKMVGTVTKYNGGRSMNRPTVARAEGTVGTYRTPAPVVLDAEKFAEYTSADADFATPYVMITGVAETDDNGNFIVKLVDGETTYSVKSYYGNDSFADWDGKEVKAYGYAYNAYADTKQVNLVAVTVLDADAEEPTGPEITPIASVLALGQDAVIPEGTTVEGVVISNAALSNLTSKKGMYLQDESGAVQLRFTEDHTFAFGDKIQLDLSGVTVGAYFEAVQLSVDNTKAVVISKGNTVTPKTVTMADFLANKYEGQYVALEGVQVVEADLAKTWIMPGSNNEAAHTSINMEDAEGNTFVVFSSKYSTFGGTTVAQGSGTIKGISAKSNATIQIIFAQESDFAGLTGARFGQEGGEEPTEKTARSLEFSSATATATLGQTFTAPTLSGEAAGVVYTSSNPEVATVDAATGDVTIVAAGQTTITAAAEETETLQAGTASYTLTVSAAEVVEPEFEAGQYWIVANNLVAKPVTSSFGYLNVEDAWKSASAVASTQANAFTFTSVEGGYTIQDEAGKYYYGTVFNNAWSKNFNVSATLPAEGAIWKIVKNDDDTYTITNTTQPSYLQYSASYKSFGHYTTAQTNAVLPTLVKVENAVPAVTLESSLTFEAEGGSQTITLPEGVSATTSCDNAAFTATASANVVTVSAAATTEAQSGVLTLVLNYNGFSITKTVDLTQKAAPVAGETVVLHETFDKCQNGDSFANNAANSSDTSIKTDVSGWTFVKGYEAYKSAKFGGSSAAGSATTPKLGVSGDMTVTFVATPWANDNTTLKLSVVGGGNLSVSTVTMKTSFSEHTVTITGATAETQLKFESNATTKCRFFLDDVKIVKK